MKISLLDLISTPVAVLNSVGVKVRVGLSSEDPMVVRRPSEEYQAYLTVYSPEGVLLGRHHLGEIPPDRRRMFDISAVAKKQVPRGDHLSVVHRVPGSLLNKVSGVVVYSLSTVGLEAASLGIPTICLDPGKALDMDPMGGWDAFKWRAVDPEGFRAALGQIRGLSSVELEEGRRQAMEFGRFYLSPVTEVGLRQFLMA